REQARGLPHVRFLGQVHPAALADLYRRAVAVLVPSLCYETFGLAAVEALAHGTPAVVRRHGALPEIVDQTGAGCSFAALEECRQSMDRLRTQPDLRVELGRRGLAAAREHWSADVHLGRYLGLIGSLLQRRAGASFSSPAPPAAGGRAA